MRTFEELEECVHSINEMERIFKGIAIEAAHMEEIQRFTELTDRTKEILVKDVRRNDGKEEPDLLEALKRWLSYAEINPDMKLPVNAIKNTKELIETAEGKEE